MSLTALAGRSEVAGFWRSILEEHINFLMSQEKTSRARQLLALSSAELKRTFRVVFKNVAEKAYKKLHPLKGVNVLTRHLTREEMLDFWRMRLKEQNIDIGSID